MKNKLSIYVLLTLSMGMTTPVVAAEAFVGPSVGVKVSSVDNEVDYGGFLEGRSSSDTDVTADIYASYGFSLSNRWVINVGASYSLNDSDFGTENYLDSGNPESIKTDLDNHWSLYIEPGYKLSDKWLAYAKLSYHDADGEFDDTVTGRGSANLDGTGYGVGVAYAYSNNVEARIEFQEIGFDRERVDPSTGEPEISAFSLSLGYRF